MSKKHLLQERRVNMLYPTEVIATVIQVWKSHNSRMIIQELQNKGYKDITRPNQITYIASQIRKLGYVLPRKTVKGVWGNLVEEAIKEYDLKLEKEPERKKQNRKKK